MLKTTFQTTDAGTGKELPIPPDLRANVQRADGVLKDMLGKVGEKFEITGEWLFEPEPTQNFAVRLRLSTDGKAISWTFTKHAFEDEASVRRNLWFPIKFLIPHLDEQVDRQLESVRRGLEALQTATGD